MSVITTHVLDLMTGRPGAAIPVALERKTHTAGWQVLAERITDSDGRVSDFITPGQVFLPGHYRLVFETGPYFLVHEVEVFFPQVSVSFVAKDTSGHYHVPLLLSATGYTTYRGS